MMYSAKFISRDSDSKDNKIDGAVYTGGLPYYGDFLIPGVFAVWFCKD